ncbi:MAG: hypothetical protein M3478_00585, partial [Planctomycetota bacterium]|nr:hypothetical protein [Planctomycetota bacterium]
DAPERLPRESPRTRDLPRAPSPGDRLAGRGYFQEDLDVIRTVGPCSGYMAVLVLCLYVNSPNVLTHYRSPQILWFLAPILLYWVTRVWFLAQRRQLNDDPVLFAVRDGRSYIVGFLGLVVFILASFW